MNKKSLYATFSLFLPGTEPFFWESMLIDSIFLIELMEGTRIKLNAVIYEKKLKKRHTVCISLSILAKCPP